MATLESIRKRGKIVAFVVGFALLAFILGDFINSSSTLFGGQDRSIGEISGNSIDANLYFQKVQELEDLYRQQGRLEQISGDMVRSQVWEELVQDFIMEDEYKEIGLAIEYPTYSGISPEEVFDMVKGKNVDPMIRQLFTNPQTGEFNPATVINFLKQMNSSDATMAQWLQIEKELLRKRISTKYNNLIQKGLFVTSMQAKQEHFERNLLTNIDYLEMRYNLIADTAVTVTDKDLEKYFEANKYKFRQEASRDIAYVSFNIAPSKSDSAATEKQVRQIFEEFKTTDDAESFVKRNSDVDFNPRSLKKEELTAPFDTVMFAIEVGSIYGPVLDNNYWKFAKLLSRENVPDSIQARHILVGGDKARATQVLDSLKLLIDGGADFGQLALQFSQDQGSAQNGGMLEWFTEGQMIKEFNDACVKGDLNKLQVVETKAGMHLVQVLERKAYVNKVRVASVEIELKASPETRNMLYTQASAFASSASDAETFDKTVVEQKLNKLIANNLTTGASNIAGMQESESLVKAAFRAEKGDILLNPYENKNPVFEIQDRFIVAYLTEVREKGTPELESIRQELEFEVIKEKKAEKFMTQFNDAMKSAKSLQDVAAKLGIEVRTTANVSFGGFQIPAIGVEPQVIAHATALPLNKMSSPIKGASGVFIVVVTSTNDFKPADYGQEMSRLVNDLQTRSSFQVYQALREAANVVDYRYNF